MFSMLAVRNNLPGGNGDAKDMDMDMDIDSSNPDRSNLPTDPYYCPDCETRHNYDARECDSCAEKMEVFERFPVKAKPASRLPKKFCPVKVASVKAENVNEPPEKLPSEFRDGYDSAATYSGSDESDESEDEECRDQEYYVDKHYPDLPEIAREFISEYGLDQYKEYLAAKELIDQVKPTEEGIPNTCPVSREARSLVELYDDFERRELNDQMEDDQQQADMSGDDTEDEDMVRPSYKLDIACDLGEAMKYSFKGQIDTELNISELEEKMEQGKAGEDEVDEIIDTCEDEFEKRDKQFNSAWGELLYEFHVFSGLECYRRSILSEEDDDSPEAMEKFMNDLDPSDTYYDMKIKPDIDRIESITMDELSDTEYNGNLVPRLFIWGYRIGADVMHIQDECSSDWEREHSQLEYVTIVAPYLRAINKRIIALNPDWKDVEIEIRSLAEIRKEQNSIEPIINWLRFRRLVKEVSQDYTAYDLKWEPEAIEALQVAAEDFLIKFMNKSNRVAIHAGRDYITKSDFDLIQDLNRPA
jgi:histone H3/H4